MLVYPDGSSVDSNIFATPYLLLPKNILTTCMLEIRAGNSASLFSMDDLFLQLQAGAQYLDDAMVVEELIKELWKESPNCDLRAILDNSVAEILAGNHDDALIKLSKLVKSEPSYGQAWSEKVCSSVVNFLRAQCATKFVRSIFFLSKTTSHYLIGQKDLAMESAQNALQIDSRNFQAHAAIGLMEMEASRFDKAIASFRLCLTLNPWLGNISSLLSLCISKVGNSVNP